MLSILVLGGHRTIPNSGASGQGKSHWAWFTTHPSSFPFSAHHTPPCQTWPELSLRELRLTVVHLPYGNFISFQGLIFCPHSPLQSHLSSHSALDTQLLKSCHVLPRLWWFNGPGIAFPRSMASLPLASILSTFQTSSAGTSS